MIIKTLAENTSISDQFKNEHGLSLYIETKKHKILFDVGASDLFLENAKKLGVEISDIDYLIISHGHYDHGGGLETFLKHNTTAKVFIKEEGFGEFATGHQGAKAKYIGLDQKLKNHRQIHYAPDQLSIAKGIELFSNVSRKVPEPLSNDGLLINKKGKLIKDSFDHEQNLMIEEDGRVLLITGCAHNGIVNIVDHFYDLKGRMPDYVIGGFHLSSRSGKDERPETVEEIGRHLLSTKAKYYTCHCTGVEAYDKLKVVMGRKIDYLSCGSNITI